MFFLDHAWLIPVLPAVAFAIILLVGKRLPGKGAEIGITAILASLVLSLLAAAQWIQRVNDAGAGHEGALGFFTTLGRSIAPRAATAGGEHAAVVEPVIHSITWWQSGSTTFGIGTHIDGLAVALVVVVTIISSLVQIFSLEYMRGDRRYTHYFAGLSLFTAGMLNLVVAENTLQLLLGWEIMGLCSFMLIGHWWEEQANSDAALKAFFTTRTGDIGLLVGISIVFFGAGQTFSIYETNEMATNGQISHLVLLMASIALFIAVIGKSGQFPLHTWLPDAMAGPTPVSALIHAATMVVAGVYLVARLYPVFYDGFSIGNGGVNPMVLIGGITILIAAALAFVQVDIKKVLAYSTVSQLGYMVMGLGAGAWTAAVFHIFTHAFFKALLFLGAGSISHSGSHHSFNMKTSMGGLRKKMPITFWTFIIGTLALAGIFPFAGFWSKDEILVAAGANGYSTFMVIGLIGAFMTAAYMTRCVYLTFFGEYRGGDHHGDVHAPDPALVGALHASEGNEELTLEHDLAVAHDDHGHGVPAHGAAAHGGHDEHFEPHESPLLLTVPLMILAALAMFGGLLNAAPFGIEKFKDWVEPTIAYPEFAHADFSYSKAIVSVCLALAGGVIVFALYQRDLGRLRGLTRRSRLASAGYTFLWNKYYLDDLYEKGVVYFIKKPLAAAMYWINQHVIDGVVNGVGRGSVGVGRWTYRHIDQQVVDGAVNGAGLAAGSSGGFLRTLQTGRVSQYGALLFAAAGIGALILVIVV